MHPLEFCVNYTGDMTDRCWLTALTILTSLTSLTLARSVLTRVLSTARTVARLVCLLSLAAALLVPTIALGQDSALSQRLQPLIAAHRGQVSIAVKHLGTGEECLIDADRVMPTASLIKFPLMVSAYGRLARGELQREQRLAVSAEDKVPGSGILTDHFSPGTDLSLLDVIHLMIVWSDNTATNMVVDQVGLDTLNQDMAALGLSETRMNSKVYRGDQSVDPARSKQYGLGSTTAREMVRLLEMLERGELHSPEICAEMKAHLLVCDDPTKIVRFMPPGVRVAHKSGEISTSRTEAGIIYSGSGPIAVCVLTTNNEDQSFDLDNEAHLLISRIALEAYRHFNPFGEAPREAGDLAEGSTGEQVTDLQRTLNARLTPSPGLTVDGLYGPATAGAVKALQRETGLPETGAMDAPTWTALGPLVPAEAPPDLRTIDAGLAPLEAADALAGPPFVTAEAWAVLDGVSGELLAGHLFEEPREIASTTKIMTAWVILQQLREHPEMLSGQVQFSQRAHATEGSAAGLRPGESVSVDELMYGMLLPSGNDASVALGEHFGASMAVSAEGDPLADFVTRMNEESQRMGLVHSHWKNTSGLPDPENLSTASELARLAWHAMQNEAFRRYVGTRNFGCKVCGPGGHFRTLVWENTNRLLGVEGYAGVKTGTTEAAGACLVAQCTRGEESRIVVVLGCPSSAARYADSRNLFRWSWSLLPPEDQPTDQ